MIDPGLMTDSTGDGMAGATDVGPFTQEKLKNTYYNGSKPCTECGIMLDPRTILQTQLCPNCSNRKSYNLVKNRMVG
jgi:predicted RNA-binding Zn-ribbon protein involved in translation (DUF1610 family)